MQFTPIEFSQSHTSVPSRSIAKIWYPPPGNTTTAVPVLFSFGAYSVSVGSETCPSRTSSLPAISGSFGVVVSTSGAGFAGASGAPFGHKCNVMCPGAGCHAGVCANSVAALHATTDRISKYLRFIGGISFLFVPIFALDAFAVQIARK